MCTRTSSGDFVDPRDLEVVEVALLHAAVLERDLAVFGERKPHHSRAFTCECMRSGLTQKPQSIAVSTRGIV